MPVTENTTGYYPARMALRVPAEMQEAVTVAARLQFTCPVNIFAAPYWLRSDRRRTQANSRHVAQPEARAR